MIGKILVAAGITISTVCVYQLGKISGREEVERLHESLEKSDKLHMEMIKNLYDMYNDLEKFDSKEKEILRNQIKDLEAKLEAKS